jgi:hypothetical protein
MSASNDNPDDRNYYAEAYNRVMFNQKGRSTSSYPSSFGEIYALAMKDMPKAVR